MDDARPAALERLEVFVGEWEMAATFPNVPPGSVPEPASEGRPRSTFAWDLDQTFLVQRSFAPHPAPNSLAIVSAVPGTDMYTQHYFDSRGVVRNYAMAFADNVWTLTRISSDFSPLDFAQRFTGLFSADGNVIDGKWESSHDGASWELDFPLTYTRLA